VNGEPHLAGAGRRDLAIEPAIGLSEIPATSSSWPLPGVVSLARNVDPRLTGDPDHWSSARDKRCVDGTRGRAEGEIRKVSAESSAA